MEAGVVVDYAVVAYFQARVVVSARVGAGCRFVVRDVADRSLGHVFVASVAVWAEADQPPEGLPRAPVVACEFRVRPAGDPACGEPPEHCDFYAPPGRVGQVLTESTA